MKKNKSIFWSMMIMLGISLVQPLNASTPATENGFSRVSKCAGVAVGATGLYLLGCYYQKKNIHTSKCLGKSMQVAGVPAAYLGALMVALVSPPLLLFDYHALSKTTSKNVVSLTPLFLTSLYIFLLGNRLVDYAQSKEKILLDIWKKRDYVLIKRFLEENPECINTSVGFDPLFLEVADDFLGVGYRSPYSHVPGSDAMMHWLIEHRGCNHAVEDWRGDNIAHYISRYCGRTSDEFNHLVFAKLSKRAINQKNKDENTPLQLLIGRAEDGNGFAEKTKLMEIMLDKGADMGEVEQYFNTHASAQLKDWYAAYCRRKGCLPLVVAIQEAFNVVPTSYTVPGEIAVLASEYLQGDIEERAERVQCIKAAEQVPPVRRFRMGFPVAMFNIPWIARMFRHAHNPQAAVVSTPSVCMKSLGMPL